MTDLPVDEHEAMERVVSQKRYTSARYREVRVWLAAREYSKQREEKLDGKLKIALMERDWLLGAWAAMAGIPQAEAEAEMLVWSKKWRETALAELQPLCQRQDVALTEAYRIIAHLIGRPANEPPLTHARRSTAMSEAKAESYRVPDQKCATCGQCSRGAYHWDCARDRSGRLLVKEER